MRLDTYHSCTRAEKREVLAVFWRRGVTAPPRLTTAAVEYGPWAALCCAILALEPLPVLAVTAGHGSVVLAVTAAVEALLVASLWWSVVRLRAVRRLVAAPAP